MQAWIDIENSKTKKVITLNVPVIQISDNEDISFDISGITREERELLIPAIDPSKELEYTDIEMFFLETKPGVPHFGPDYEFTIQGDVLSGIYTRSQWLEKQKKGDKK